MNSISYSLRNFSDYLANLCIFNTRTERLLNKNEKEGLINNFLSSYGSNIPVYFGYGGLGDNILLEAATENIGRKTSLPVLVLSDYPELFIKNPYIDYVFCNIHEVRRSQGYIDFLLQLNLIPVFLPYWSRHIYKGKRTIILPYFHLVQKMSMQAGLLGNISIVPRLYHFTTLPVSIQDALKPPYIITQSVGKSPWKSWPTEKMQHVINELRSRFQFVQVGLEKEPLLDNVLDLRGKLTVLQLATLMREATLFAGNIGGLMHVARAVGTRSVIAYSSTEPLVSTGYDYNSNILPKEPCRLCATGALNMFLKDVCPNKYKCVTTIESVDFIAAVERLSNECKYDYIENRTIEQTISTFNPYLQYEYNAWIAS